MWVWPIIGNKDIVLCLAMPGTYVRMQLRKVNLQASHCQLQLASYCVSIFGYDITWRFIKIADAKLSTQESTVHELS